MMSDSRIPTPMNARRCTADWYRSARSAHRRKMNVSGGTAKPVERAMIVATGPQLTIALPTASAAATKRSARLADVEKEHIRRVLESAGWRIRGPGGAADRLGLKPTTLETRMAKLGLKRPQTVGRPKGRPLRRRT
jgi:transcriptional regulator with GAF, ATPase, and Fis domain